MRSLIVASLTIVMLMCATSASARGWRDLRIDASSEAGFDESVQQMRDQLPGNRVVLFDLVLQDLKARFAPPEYRQQLNGLGYKPSSILARRRYGIGI